MSIKIVNRYNSNQILHDSSNYPEFSGALLKEFVEFLVKNNTKLSYADLSYADLSYADLSYADLSYADLSYAKLSYAKLSYADLSYADLSYAKLSNAKLSNAKLYNTNLSYADLSNTKLSNAKLSYVDLPIFCKWSVRFTLPFTIHIGCKSKTIKEWDNWFKKDTETFDHKRDSQQFKLIYANYLAVRSYLKEAHKQKLFHEIEVKRNGIKQKEWQINL